MMMDEDDPKWDGEEEKQHQVTGRMIERGEGGRCVGSGRQSAKHWKTRSVLAHVTSIKRAKIHCKKYISDRSRASDIVW